jgi:Zn-dependent protease
MVLVAAAGPGINLILAIISGALLHVVNVFSGDVSAVLVRALWGSIYINVLLAVFNMLPLPPLDGGRVAVGLLPERPARQLARLERWGIPILIVVLFIAPLVAAQFGASFTPFRSVVMPIVQFFIDIIATVTGTGTMQ